MRSAGCCQQWRHSHYKAVLWDTQVLACAMLARVRVSRLIGNSAFEGLDCAGERLPGDHIQRCLVYKMLLTTAYASSAPNPTRSTR